jgi:iron complex outermembrane receptor protein
MVNNILSEKYESNAWIYRYYSEGRESFMDGYFPQATINFMAGVSLKF